MGKFDMMMNEKDSKRVRLAYSLFVMNIALSILSRMFESGVLDVLAYVSAGTLYLSLAVFITQKYRDTGSFILAVKDYDVILGCLLVSFMLFVVLHCCKYWL